MRILFRFIIRFHVFMLFVLLEGLAFSLFFKTHYYQSSKINNWANETAGTLYNSYNQATDYFHLKQNNNWLTAENARLRAEISQSYISFVDTVFQVKDTVYHLAYTYVDAKIISNSTSDRNNYLMLNKGKKHGIKSGMAVIAPEGVVGVVKIVSENFSSVMSLLHSDMRLSVKLKKKGYAGSVVWRGGFYRTGDLIDVPSHFRVNEGDTVITSGYSLDFPEGVIVGTVSAVETEAGDNFHHLKILFAIDFKRLDNVYVVNNLFKKEQLELQKMQNANE